MKRTAEQEMTYNLLYRACKKKLTKLSLSSPDDLHYILEVLNGVVTRVEAAKAVAA
jgi:hypothetical protein